MTKIQINSLDALERLLGGDTELEFEIRNNIAADFAKKHLKGIVDQELLEDYKELIVKEIEIKYFNRSRSPFEWKGDLKLSQEVLSLIQSEIDKVLFGKIGAMISKYISDTFAFRQLETELEKAANYISELSKEAILNKKLDELVNQKIKEKLNLP